MTDAEEAKAKEQSEFHIEEYKRIGDVLEARIKDSTDLLKYVVLSSAAIVGWLTATDYQTPANLRAFAWSMPVVICILGAARDYGTGIQMDTLQAYLRDMEGRLADPELKGYQRFNRTTMEDLKARTPFDWAWLKWFKWRKWLMAAINIKWVYALLIVGCALFFALNFNQSPPDKKHDAPCVPCSTDAVKPKADGT